MPHLLVFTDLDGTLLDHHTYSWQPARPALERLDGLKIPLILCSSKTSPEMLGLRAELGNRHPFIVENGGAVCVPKGYFGKGSPQEKEEFDVHFLGRPYQELLELIHGLRSEKGYEFKGFSDSSDEEVAQQTGLTVEKAALARQRLCSEPMLWQGDEASLEAFRTDLEAEGLRLVRGGRFYHVMGKTDKAVALRWLAQRYRNEGVEDIVTAALGDSPNDRGMLEAVNIPVVILSAKGERMSLANDEAALHPEGPGPVGWQQAMNVILDRLFPKGV